MENKEINMDELLREAFLELDFDQPKNERLLLASSDALFTKNNIGGAINGSQLGGIKMLLFIGLLTAFTLLIVGLNNNTEARYRAAVVNFEKFEEEELTIKLPKMSLHSFNIPPTATNFKVPKRAAFIAPIITEEEEEKIKIFRPKEVQEMPNLSKEELQGHEKRKKDFIKGILKLDKSRYFKVEEIEGENLEPFAIWKAELSNIEYRIFLHDLIVKQKKEEYFEAKTKDEAWLGLSKDTSFMEPMKKLYSIHPAYDKYPVVNVSRKAARMFCEWLTEELKRYPTNKQKIKTIRIPTNKEWEYAASSGGKYTIYPWGGPYVRNSKGNYLANFYPEEGNYTADDALFTAQTMTYIPNEFGLYNIAGNAAEMVDYPHNGNIGAKGGSWKDVAKHIQVNAEDINLGISDPKPTIGFRPVIVYEGEASTATNESLGEISVALTEEQIQANNKRKMKMISELLNLRKHNFFLVHYQMNEEPVKYKEKYITFKRYYIQKTEVSNIEYKTFLFDLIIQKRLDDFHAAKPNQQLWRIGTVPNEPYVEHYFSHPAYDNYPVVNITAKGAEMYGMWLLEEAKKLDDKHKLSQLKQLRLPTEKEWVVAATAYGTHFPYPWKESGVRSEVKKHKGKLLANFMAEKGDHIGVAGRLNDNADITAPVKSYWPNDFGLYNMAGNVAEMIHKEDGTYGCRGGSWRSNAQQIRIDAIDTSIGVIHPSPTIGFRLVGEFEPNKATLTGAKGVNTE